MSLHSFSYLVCLHPDLILEFHFTILLKNQTMVWPTKSGPEHYILPTPSLLKLCHISVFQAEIFFLRCLPQTYLGMENAEVPENRICWAKQCFSNAFIFGILERKIGTGWGGCGKKKKGTCVYASWARKQQ